MIKTIQLQNFKCFKNEKIALSNLNLLTGLNGMGKSTVIQSLLLLRQNIENGLLIQQKRLGLNGEYVNIGNSYDLLHRYFDKKQVGISVITDDELSFGWIWNTDENTDSLSEIWNENTAGNLSEISLFNTKFHYINAERVGPRPYYETSSTKVIHQNQLGVKGEYAANYFSLNQAKPIPIENLKYSSIFGEKDSSNEIGLSLYEQVNAWLSIIRPGAQARIKDQPDSGTNTLSFEFLVSKDNPGSFRSTNVGFGLTYVFPLLISILASEPGTILLIENPEAHIHPKGQAELGVLISIAAANGIQLIVETHSDHILNGIRYAVKSGLISKDLVNLLFFTGTVANDKFSHYIEYINITENGKLTHRPTGFFDVWDDMLIKLI